MAPRQISAEYSLCRAFCPLVLVWLFLAFPSFAQADGGHVSRLTPSGSGDDTLQLQAALETCSSIPSLPEDESLTALRENGRDKEEDDDENDDRKRCTIVLSEGVFHTDVLLVQTFRGRIRGQGKGRTIIRPIETLRSTANVFVDPPSLSAPYPILLHFADGGDIRLSHFTLDFPATLQVGPYSIAGGEPVQNALLSAIMVDGTDKARLRISNLEIIAAETTDPLTFGSVLLNAIRFEGQIRVVLDPATGETIDDLTTPLAKGNFTARNVSTTGSGNVFALRDARNVHASIFDNHLRDARLNAINMVDLGDSDVRVEDNFISSGSTGLAIFRGGRPSDVPSTFIVEDNRFVITDRSSEFSGLPGDGIFFIDFTPDGGIDRVLIRDNRIALRPLGPPFLGFFDGIFVLGDGGGVRITGNTFSGSVIFAGIFVDGSVGTRTRRNDFSNLQNDFSPDFEGPVDQFADVWLGAGTSQSRVVEPGATVIDEGTDNIVVTDSDD